MSLEKITDTYFKRYAFQAPQLPTPLHPATKVIVVIPSYNEPTLLQTLHSLKNCTPTQFPVEVIIVINAGENTDKEVQQLHQETLTALSKWIPDHTNDLLSFQVIHVPQLPQKHAGVGLARKIGMDEATWRFRQIGYDGAIVCFDADSTVSENYLAAFEKAFVAHPAKTLATIYFEHPYHDLEDTHQREGIIYYELFLRYYIQGLKYAGYPYAMHTIGSSMAARASLYAKQGGMNRRKAGEDFYFLHKLAPHGQLVEITEAQVYPSCRQSDRVPFGTGKAQNDWVLGQSKIIDTYNPTVFEGVKALVESVQSFYAISTEDYDNYLQRLPMSVQTFPNEHHFLDSLHKINKNTSSKAAFQKKYFQWLDGFKVLKYVHFARDRFYGTLALPKAAQGLLKKKNSHYPLTTDAEALLAIYRALDRGEEQKV